MTAEDDHSNEQHPSLLSDTGSVINWLSFGSNSPLRKTSYHPDHPLLNCAGHVTLFGALHSPLPWGHTVSSELN